MRKLAFALVPFLACTICAVAYAQEATPRLPVLVVDLHGTFPAFPQDSRLAASRGLNEVELPGRGLGVDVGVHLYPLKWRAVTLGIGGNIMAGRSNAAPSASSLAAAAAAGLPTLRDVAERFTVVAPQISLNFGSGNGWSYLSGGLGRSTWSIVPEGQPEGLADQQSLKTLNYGGGARWFAKKRLAFSLDVRFYAVNPGLPQGEFPGSPRTTLLVIGAGVSLK